jgi:rhomboid protease GluP
LWHENTSSVGASGAIFGLYGAILALLLTDAFGKGNKKGILIFIGVYVVVNLAWGLTGGIDNAAHIGGLVSGALIGPLLYQFSKEVK